MTERLAVRGLEKMPTRVSGVDEVLQGGLPLGRATLLAGGPGTGKTLLALEMLYRGALAGEAGMFVTFEEPAESVRDNAAAMGWDLASLEAAGKLFVFHAEIPPGAILSGEFDIGGLLAILGGKAQAMGARLVVVDAIDVLLRVYQDRQLEQNELHKLHAWLRGRGLTGLISAKMIEDGPSQPYPFLEYLSDCVIRLDQRVVEQVRTRRLRVLKYRGSGFLSNEYPYVILEGGIVLLPVSMTSLEYAAPGPRVSTGNAALDEISGGGYRQGTCVLVVGLSGTGKTTLVSTFAAAACGRGERVLYVSFEESAGSLISGIVLLPVSMTSLEYAAPGPRVSTGNAALDEISGGGWRQGTCVLVVGLSGTGKTTLVSTFGAAACGRGERVLYVSFEESAGSLISGMGNVGIGLGGWQERGLLTILTAMPEAAGVEEHLVRLFRTMDVVGPKHVVVDAISACRRMGSEVAAFDFLVRLLTRCKDRGITCLFTNQGSADIAQVEVSGLGISSLVDVLVTLHYHEENGEMGRQVQVLKSRGSRHSTRRHRFRITDGGMEVDADGRFGARKGGR